jgi:polyisoprenoid-binding protein YceI
MKKIVLAVALLVSSVGIYSFTTKVNGDVLTTDVIKSKVEFIGSKTDGYHTGYFLLKDGQVTLENGKLTSGKFTINLASLKITDDAGEKLEGHLKSPDFFDFSKSTEATFSISNVTYTSDNKADIDGILTLKGITSPVKFTALIRNAKDDKFFAEAQFSIDRTAFGLSYGKGKISDDVQITVHLFAKK